MGKGGAETGDVAHRFVKFRRLLVSSPDGWRVKYEIPGGPGFGFGVVYEAGAIAVARMYLPKGCEVPRHVHEVDEWLLVWRGKYEMYMGGEVRILERGTVAHFPPGVAHGGKVRESVWMLMVTMPPEDGYPRAPWQPNHLAQLDREILRAVIDAADYGELAAAMALVDADTLEVVREGVERRLRRTAEITNFDEEVSDEKRMGSG